MVNPKITGLSYGTLIPAKAYKKPITLWTLTINKKEKKSSEKRTATCAFPTET
jgi:hypothetical protein